MIVSIAILVALASAATQAIAHALMKSGRDVLIVRVWIGMTGALAMIPICLFVRPPSTELLPWLLSSNIIHAIHCTFSRAEPGESECCCTGRCFDHCLHADRRESCSSRC